MPTPPPTDTLNLLIATYLEPEYIEQIRAVSPRLHVVYRPDLIPPARYAADHYNTITRTPDQEAEWRDLLAQADLMFDFDPTHRADLPELAPRVRWIQASSAGIGQFVHRQQYDTRMPQTIFTTASGIHARPLAEFCCMAILMHTRGALHTLQLQRQRRWERYAGTDLEGRTLGIHSTARTSAATSPENLCRMSSIPTYSTDRRQPIYESRGGWVLEPAPTPLAIRSIPYASAN